MFRTPRILVVEGDRSAAELLAHIFEVDDYDVSIVHDGSFALRVARSERPNAILLDLELPRIIDGPASSARKSAWTPTLHDVPVVAILERADYTVTLGASAVIWKPLDRASLQLLLRRVHGYAGPPGDGPEEPPRSHRGTAASGDCRELKVD